MGDSVVGAHDRARKSATKEVTRRSNGQKVMLQLSGVDRQRQLVAIEIKEYNARFTFRRLGDKVDIILREQADNTNSADKPLLHVSRTVYAAMTQWAASILHDERKTSVSA